MIHMSYTDTISDFASLFVSVGGCGSCYAFSAMGMNEARWRLRTNNTEQPVFSPQDIVECSEYSQGNSIPQHFIPPPLPPPPKTESIFKIHKHVLLLLF